MFYFYVGMDMFGESIVRYFRFILAFLMMIDDRLTLYFIGFQNTIIRTHLSAVVMAMTAKLCRLKWPLDHLFQ